MSDTTTAAVYQAAEFALRSPRPGPCPVRRPGGRAGRPYPGKIIAVMQPVAPMRRHNHGSTLFSIIRTLARLTRLQGANWGANEAGC